MLDFYIINDSQSKPSYPEQIGLELAGSLDEIAFSALQDLGIIDSRFDYYADFRLDSILISQVNQSIYTKKVADNHHVIQLLHMIRKTEMAGAGLIAYGD